MKSDLVGCHCYACSTTPAVSGAEPGEFEPSIKKKIFNLARFAYERLKRDPSVMRDLADAEKRRASGAVFQTRILGYFWPGHYFLLWLRPLRTRLLGKVLFIQ